MKILHIIPSIDPSGGGPNISVLDMASFLSERGIQVSVCYTRGGSIDGKETLNEVSTSVKSNGFERSFPKRFSASKTLDAWLTEHVLAFDAVHIHSIFSVCSLKAGAICRTYNVPYIVRPHGSLDPFDLRKKRWLKLLVGALWVRRHLLGAAAIHCTSALEAERIQTFGVVTRRIVVPLPIRERKNEGGSRFDFRAFLGCGAGDFVILFMSRLHPKKNLEAVIDSVTALSERYPFLHLAIAGVGEQTYEEQLKARAKVILQRKKATFCGFLQGAAKSGALMESDLFVLPSYNENFGVVVIEALQAGLPVLISDEVYICREVRNAGAGVVCSTAPESVQEKLETMLKERTTNASHLREMGKKARVLAQSTFSPGFATDSLVKLYSSIVGSPP